MNSKVGVSRRQSADFERETKLVVLNFLSIVPTSCPATAEVCEAVRVDVSSDVEAEDSVVQRSCIALPDTNCYSHSVTELNHDHHCSMGTTDIQDAELSGENSNEPLDKNDCQIDMPEIDVDSCDEDETVIAVNFDSHAESSYSAASNSRPFVKSTQEPHSELLQPPVIHASSRTPSPVDGDSPTERRLSSQSTNSSRSRSPGSRVSSINLQMADLQTLVRAHALPPLVIPLRDSISHEIELLEQGRHRVDDDDAQGCAPLYFKSSFFYLNVVIKVKVEVVCFCAAEQVCDKLWPKTVYNFCGLICS